MNPLHFLPDDIFDAKPVCFFDKHFENILNTVLCLGFATVLILIVWKVLI
jgi:hypothetical protein